jgi:hypothetical protein
MAPVEQGGLFSTSLEGDKCLAVKLGTVNDRRLSP